MPDPMRNQNGISTRRPRLRALAASVVFSLAASAGPAAAQSGSGVRETRPARPASASSGATTRLDTGDVVEVRVLRHDDELGGKFTLGPEGGIELQLIGRVPLRGLTPEQAGQRITALLADGWLRKPQVTVNVAEYARNIITVSGEVRNGNAFNVPRNKPFTVAQAIGMAGGCTPRANTKAVILKRGDKSYTVNLKAVFDNPKLDMPLRDGDVLLVKASAF